MNKIQNNLIAILFAILCCTNSAIASEDGQFTVTISPDNPIALTLEGKETDVKELKINGIINQADFDFIKTLPNMYLIDMSEAELGSELNNTIPSNIFRDNSLITSITFPTNAKEVATAAFENMASLTDVVLNEGLKNLHISAFNNCTKLANINFPKSLESICGSSFYNCQSLTSVSLGKNIKDVMDYAFNKCTNLVYVRIDGDIKRLGEHAFSQNPLLKEVYLNGEVKTIGRLAFKDNTALMTIRSATRYPQQVEPNAFYGVPTECIVEIPAGSKSKYESMYGWKSLKLVETVLEEEITISEAGKLADECYGEKMLGSLKITGPINGSDLRYISDKLSYLETLDLKYAQIVKGGVFDKYMGTEWEKENAIPDGFLNGKTNLKTLVLSNNIVEIGVSAFSGCKSLTSFKFPNNLISIGDYAFNDCTELTQITLPDALKKVAAGAFMYCAKLKSISIGEKLSELADDAFGECPSLATIKVSDTNESFIATKNVLYTKGFDTLLLYPAAKPDTEYTLNNNTKIIAPLAFKDATALKKIIVSTHIEEIGTSAFANTSSVETIFIANALRIGNSCFSGMTALKDIFVSGENPAMITDTDPFSGGWLTPSVDKTQITLHTPDLFAESYKNSSLWKDMPITIETISKTKTVENVTAGNLGSVIGNDLFYIEELTVSGTLNGDDLQLLANIAGLKKLNISACSIVKGGQYAGKEWMKDGTIPDYWMENNQTIAEITLPNVLESIGQQAFGDCKALASVIIGEETKKINTGAFIRSGLKSIIIPDKVTSLGWASAFSECKQLEKLHLGKEVESLGMHTFFGCTALKEISVSTDNCNFTAENNVLFSKEKQELFLYCIGNESKEYTVPSTVMTIDVEAFYGSPHLEKIICNEGLVTIAMSAFAECENLKEIVFPNSLETIEMEAMLHCTALTEINLGNNVSLIEANAFSGCLSLSKIHIGESITIIEEFAFSHCPSVVSLKVDAINPPDAYNAFSNEDDTENIDYNICKLYVPTDAIEAYKQADGWNEFLYIEAATDYIPVLFMSTSLQKGDNVSMNIVANQDVYYIDLGDGTISEQKSGYLKTKALGSELKIYGDIVSIVANNMKINKVDVVSNSLELLNLSTNNLTSFNLPSADKMTSLALEDNQLETIVLPESMDNLKTLNIKRNKLTSIPNVAMPELVTLIAGDNTIKEMDLSMYTKLERIRINKSGVEKIKLPVSCVELHAEDNNLTFADDEIKGFEKLVTLRLSRNTIEGLTVYDCPSLKELELNDNGLKTLSIKDLSALNLLWLKNNQLSSITLNGIYESLPIVEKGTIKVEGNSEAEKANGYIAEEKGWTIDIKGTSTEIESLHTTSQIKQIYNYAGEKRETLSKGINILIMDDGTVRKVYVK